MRSSVVQMGLFAASVLVYWNALPADFAFDDAFAIVGNKDVTDDSAPMWGILKHDFWGQDIRSEQSHKSYRPLTIAAFRWVWRWWRWFVPTRDAGANGTASSDALDSRSLNPFPFHLANVVLHSLTSVLVFSLSLKICGLREEQSIAFTGAEAGGCGARHSGTSSGVAAPGRKERTRKRKGRVTELIHRIRAKKDEPVNECTKDEAAPEMGSPPQYKTPSRNVLIREAALSATLFALHPIHTEAVTGLVGLAEILCAIFGVSGLLCYIRAAEKRGLTHCYYLFLAMACSILAALAKEIGITMVGSMALLDVLFLSFHRQSQKGLARNKIWMLIRLLLLGLTGAGYVMLRSWVSGGSQIVNIYRKVENPIPFAESVPVRVYTTLYVHASYAWLLIYPMHLSADWSYACIPYVRTLGDPRNLLTAGLYFWLLHIILAAKPWMIAWEFLAARPPDARLAHSRWRFVVVIGLLVAPFFPASNVLFYVGTVIGERLLYLPSVGFCMMAAHVLLSTSPDRPNQSTKSKGMPNCLSALAIAALLAFYSWRTVDRNWDWKDEEALFVAAQKVCSNSAKVRLNSGIVERRHGNWDAALAHFHAAIEIEPTYCDPIYWIGSTLVNAKKISEGIMELKKSLQCVHVARHALEALNKVYVALTEAQPENPMMALAWGEVLLHPAVNRTGEACIAMEQASILAAFNHRSQQIVEAATKQCIQKLEHHTATANSMEGKPYSLPTLVKSDDVLASVDAQALLKCVKGRQRVALTVAEHGHRSKAAKRSVYKYIKDLADVCRNSGTNIHQMLIVRFQNADSEDPWLQLEWGKIVVLSGHLPVGKRHLEAAGMMFSSYLTTFLGDRQNPPPTATNSHPPLPMSMLSTGPITPREAVEGGVESLEALVDLMDLMDEDANQKGVENPQVCQYLSYICDIKMKGILLLDQRDKRRMDRCLAGLRNRPYCASELSQTIAILKSRLPE